MDAISKVLRSDINALMQYPIVRCNGYDNIRYIVSKSLDFNSDLLDIPASPILLCVGPKDLDFGITLKFYSNALELFNVAFTDLLLKYRNCMFTNLEYFMFSSKFVSTLNQIFDKEIVETAVEALCKNAAKEHINDDEVLGVVRNTPEIFPLLELIDGEFLQMAPTTFGSISELRFFMENNSTLSKLFIKEIRVDGSDFASDVSYGSSTISDALLGVFDIKFISESMEGCLSNNDFKLICLLYKDLSEEERTLEGLRKISIKYFAQEKRSFVYSFFESLRLKEVFKC